MPSRAIALSAVLLSVAACSPGGGPTGTWYPLNDTADASGDTSGADQITPETLQDTATPDADGPDAGKPDADKPDADTQDVTEPDAATPDVTEPDVDTPDATEPDTAKLDVTEPDVDKPDITEPDVDKPDVTEPDAAKPDVTEPDVDKPDITEPDAAKPDITEPDAGPDVGPAVGVCCDATASAGCGASAAVESCVCGQDSYCCTDHWDTQCANEVVSFGCGTCPDDTPPPNACCDAVTTAGCSESAAVEACVCAKDEYCCGTKWDSQCAGEVVSYGCGTCQGGGSCGGDGATCSSDDECCSGFCGDILGCIGDIPCKDNGQTCGSNGDCCSAECSGGLCVSPSCKTTGQPCSASWDCCSGSCSGGFCGGAGGCGDGLCGSGESCSSCPTDCGPCGGGCGDGACGSGESCSTCPSDCGACGGGCGDGTCGSGESCTSCPGDCGPCGGTCEGDFYLGQTFYTDTSQGLGQACEPHDAPKNCYDGTYIMFPDDTCFCILACPPGFQIGDVCDDSGNWTCQHVQATNASANQMYACVPTVWNLCTTD